MADTSGMADIRGINIDKIAKGFADVDIVLKKFVTVATTPAREVRWFRKTSGFLDAPTTTGITTSWLETDFGALPIVSEQSWTRYTSYVKKWITDSPKIPIEDIEDTDISILATNIRDLVREIQNKVDKHIYTIISNSNSGTGINTNATTQPWDTASFSGCDIIEDIMEAKMNIRVDGYDPEGAVLLINSPDYKQIVTYLISSKGSSIPAFASQKVESGVVMNLLGLQVVVNDNVTADFAVVFVPQRVATYYQFMPITSTVIEQPLISKTIRVCEEGICVLTDANATNLITNTRT